MAVFPSSKCFCVFVKIQKERNGKFYSKVEVYNLGKASQKSLRPLTPVRSQGTVIYVFLRLEG